MDQTHWRNGRKWPWPVSYVPSRNSRSYEHLCWLVSTTCLRYSLSISPTDLMHFGSLFSKCIVDWSSVSFSPLTCCHFLSFRYILLRFPPSSLSSEFISPKFLVGDSWLFLFFIELSAFSHVNSLCVEVLHFFSCSWMWGVKVVSGQSTWTSKPASLMTDWEIGKRNEQKSDNRSILTHSANVPCCKLFSRWIFFAISNPFRIAVSWFTHNWVSFDSTVYRECTVIKFFLSLFKNASCLIAKRKELEKTQD